MKVLSIIMVCIALSGCGPSCEERGGKRRLISMIPIKSGSTYIYTPVYRCVGARHD